MQLIMMSRLIDCDRRVYHSCLSSLLFTYFLYKGDTCQLKRSTGANIGYLIGIRPAALVTLSRLFTLSGRERKKNIHSPFI